VFVGVGMNETLRGYEVDGGLGLDDWIGIHSIMKT
jgi:hypothetical protein